MSDRSRVTHTDRFTWSCSVVGLMLGAQGCAVSVSHSLDGAAPDASVVGDDVSVSDVSIVPTSGGAAPDVPVIPFDASSIEDTPSCPIPSEDRVPPGRVVVVDASVDVPGPPDVMPPGGPRPTAPVSTGSVTSRRPRFRWMLPAGTEGARVQVCRDRACTREVTTFDATGMSGMPSCDLPTGVLFWRLFGLARGTVDARPSATWEFSVGVRSAPVDTSWGTTLDVNGDGYADVIISNPRDAGDGPYRGGGATVYLGEPAGLSSTPHRVLGVSGSLDGFGSSVASAGDINGDGYADVIVGDTIASPGRRFQAGSAAVFLGGAAGLSSVPVRVLEGVADGDHFGQSVASAGDVNRDGRADVIVGAYGRSSGVAASVYLADETGLPSAPHRVFQGGAIDLNTNSATPIAGAGDLNGDGYADVILGTPLATYAGRRLAGSAAVYLGGAAGLSATAHRLFGGSEAYDLFGFSVASLAAPALRSASAWPFG